MPFLVFFLKRLGNCPLPSGIVIVILILILGSGLTA